MTSKQDRRLAELLAKEENQELTVGEAIELLDIERKARERPQPTIDDADKDETPGPQEYRDYRRAETFVVSGPLHGFDYPGREFESREKARRWAEAKYGRVVEEIPIWGRWAFRVPKPRVDVG